MESWVSVPPGSDFPLENLPFGVFTVRDGEDQIGIAIGDSIFSVTEAARLGFFDRVLADRSPLTAASLNAFLDLNRETWSAVRTRAMQLLTADNAEVQRNKNLPRLLFKQSDAMMRLPFEVSDYVDFYSSIEHATNMGKILRPSGEALLPNWRYVPIGYHGRASSVVIDGTPVIRPNGQAKSPDAAVPVFGPSKWLDVELEMGFVSGNPTRLGEPVPVDRAREHIFGLVIVNDWSARDIQAWEYQPLGPFLAKSFATSISPWIVTLDALEPYRRPNPVQAPPALPYLRQRENFAYDIELQILLQSCRMRAEDMPPAVIATSNFRTMYWTMAQQLAHLTSNGARILAGGLYASGTISGEAPDSYGSLMELTWRGTRPLTLPSGEQRGFLEDGDTVIMRAAAHKRGLPRIGFGEVRGTVQPAA
ncbi:MAG: fumarylacetoacetase [Candidatus Eremiobacteraeota bacterium]|nr:fumarylacetoacetase [Candidatus Eremiobacteraeota bacterium]